MTTDARYEGYVWELLPHDIECVRGATTDGYIQHDALNALCALLVNRVGALMSPRIYVADVHTLTSLIVTLTNWNAPDAGPQDLVKREAPLFRHVERMANLPHVQQDMAKAMASEVAFFPYCVDGHMAVFVVYGLNALHVVTGEVTIVHFDSAAGHFGGDIAPPLRYAGPSSGHVVVNVGAAPPVATTARSNRTIRAPAPPGTNPERIAHRDLHLRALRDMLGCAALDTRCKSGGVPQYTSKIFSSRCQWVRPPQQTDTVCALHTFARIGTAPA